MHKPETLAKVKFSCFVSLGEIRTMYCLIDLKIFYIIFNSVQNINFNYDSMIIVYSVI